MKPLALVAAVLLTTPILRADDFEGAIREASSELRAGFQAAQEAKKRDSDLEPDRCAPETERDEKIYSSDFRWNYTLPEMKEAFEKMYASRKRLPLRAYWNSEKKRYELPYMPERGGSVVLPESFIRNVARQIEQAYEKDCVDAVFFPDMGHSHFLIPKASWKSKYDAYPIDRFSEMYTEMFKDPEMEVFYHTAEQLKTRGQDGALVDDERTRWRHQTRNIAGRNSGDADLRVLQNPQSSANTVSEVEGFHWWGGGFNLSANENGCFSYQANGRTYYFDLSLFDLESAPRQTSK